jgi:hypothetical protein
MTSDKKTQIAAVGKDLFCIENEHIRDCTLADMLALMAIFELCPRGEAVRAIRLVDHWEQAAVADHQLDRARDHVIRIYYDAAIGMTAHDVEAALPIFRQSVQRINPAMPPGWAPAAADWWLHPELGSVFFSAEAGHWYCAPASGGPHGQFASARYAAAGAETAALAQGWRPPIPASAPARPDAAR